MGLDEFLALGLVALSYGAAVLLHAAWDGLDNLWVHLVVGGGSFAALLVTIHRAHREPRPRR